MALVGVGIVWGITNALIENPAKDFDKNTKKKHHDSRFAFLYDFIDLAMNYKFFIPFGINQLCSVGLNFLLGKIGNCLNSII